jgi:membrane dipeptidase
MKTAGSFVQFFAAFIEPSFCQAYAMRRAVQIFDRFHEQIEKFKDSVKLCLNYTDITAALAEEKVAAILSVEDGAAFQGELSAVRMFYKLGLRSVCLTWNHRNEIADGAVEGCTNGGLTTFGRELVCEMNRLGMLIDLSHIAEKGFWDVMELTKKPVIASHSNARKICNHRRNLTDEQILAVRDSKGVIGINFYPPFLNEGDNACIKDIIRHIEYISGLAGCETLGIGADFDGVDCLPQEITGVQDLYKVFNELLKLNYSEESVGKIAGGNFLRVIREVL